MGKDIKEFMRVLLFVAVLLLGVYVLVAGLNAFVDHSNLVACDEVAEDAHVSTKYFNDGCHVLMNGAWVELDDVVYSINANPKVEDAE